MPDDGSSGGGGPGGGAAPAAPPSLEDHNAKVGVVQYYRRKTPQHPHTRRPAKRPLTGNKLLDLAHR